MAPSASYLIAIAVYLSLERRLNPARGDFSA